MCGIAAVVGENVDLKSYDTTSMLKALESRGPDGSDTQIFFGCWLGHRRLAIIDLENGNQPMKDNELTIIYNGEIYNYQKLRKQLEKDGYIFRTQSDTEVIIKAYRKWGTGCPKKFDGMFAFAIWDDEKKELFIARDRLGIKPLYYYMDGKTLLLASEIKSLINSGKVKPQIDLRSIDEYLGLMYIKPPRTIYKDVYQFPAANYGFFRKGELNFKKYWELKHEPINIAYDEAKAKVHALLTAAVEKRLIASDVEIGSFLSGGVDSSIVTMMAAKKLNQPIKLFTVSYASHDELPYAKEVNKIINGQQYVLDIPRCSTSEFNKTIKYFDEPHADTSDFPQQLISKLAASKVKVVLSGDGADEIFLGYKWHLNSDLGNQKDIYSRRLSSICAFDNKQRKELWKLSEAKNKGFTYSERKYKETNDPISNVTLFDMTSHLPGQILTKIDRAGMMHGLEVRSPFLDTELVQFVFNLPYKYKVNKGEQKYILRDILSEYMPKDFAFRTKQGFGAPIEKWLDEPEMKKFVVNNLGFKANVRKLFSKEAVDKYLGKFYSNKTREKRAAQRIWVLFCLECWLAQNEWTL